MAPLDLQPIIDRLKATGFSLVEGAGDFAAIEKLSDFVHGSAYVVLANERNTAGNAPQPMRKAAALAAFGVAIAARNYRDNKGLAAKEDAAPLIGNVRAALIGWAPPGCTPCVWQEGAVQDYDRSTIVWLDVFTTTHVLGGKP